MPTQTVSRWMFWFAWASIGVVSLNYPVRAQEAPAKPPTTTPSPAAGVVPQPGAGAAPQAAGGTTSPPPPAPNVPLIEGLQILAGIATNFHSPLGTDGYYKITYKGTVLGEHNQIFSNLDATHQFVLPKLQGGAPSDTSGSQSAANNTPNFQVDFSRGTGTGSGGIFDILGINSFVAPHLNLRPFRTTALFSGTPDGRNLNLALGVEAPALHLQQFGVSPNAHISNWLIFGASGEQQWQRDINPKTQTAGLLTYRSFLGKAFGWEKSKIRSLPFTADDILKAYPTYDALDKEREAILAKGPHVTHTIIEDFVFQVAGENKPLPPGQQGPAGMLDVRKPEGYKQTIQNAYDGFDNGYLQEPTSALWIESTGWYMLTGNSQGDRFKNNLAVIFTLWRNMGPKARSFYQLRYENGFDRATPAIRQDRAIIAIGLNF